MLEGQATGATAVTPHDTTANRASVLYVGTAGDLVVRPEDSGADVTFVGISGWVPLRVTHVRATGTTADDIVALF